MQSWSSVIFKPDKQNAMFPSGPQHHVHFSLVEHLAESAHAVSAALHAWRPAECVGPAGRRSLQRVDPPACKPNLHLVCEHDHTGWGIPFVLSLS